MMNHFKIIVPMYNVEKWISTNIQSIKSQVYTDFEAIIIDDISTDSSYEKVQNLIQGDDRFVLVKNIEKRFALENIVRGIEKLAPKNEDIIVTLDGDDWLPNKDVLTNISKVYDSEKCFLTYGTYITYPEGARPWNITKYPDTVIAEASYRKDIWRASHLRTFKYFLWKNIKSGDFKDSKGQYYKMAWDLAFMFPMLEMAGDRQHYIEDITYVYNRANPINDDKVDHSCQLSLEKEIRLKKKYDLLEILL